MADVRRAGLAGEFDRRGVPASAKRATDAGPRVFETYKSLWEIFPNSATAPEPAFDKYGSAAHNPCDVGASFGDLTVGSSSGIDDIGQAGIGALDGPLVAQNGRYVGRPRSSTGWRSISS